MSACTVLPSQVCAIGIVPALFIGVQNSSATFHVQHLVRPCMTIAIAPGAISKSRAHQLFLILRKLGNHQGAVMILLSLNLMSPSPDAVLPSRQDCSREESKPESCAQKFSQESSQEARHLEGAILEHQISITLSGKSIRSAQSMLQRQNTRRASNVYMMLTHGQLCF